MRKYKKEKNILLKKHVKVLRQYCKGCQYFEPDRPVNEICTLIGWYKYDNIDKIRNLAKGCPCYKCLVKASCKEMVCPLWLTYVSAQAHEMNKPLYRDKK